MKRLKELIMKDLGWKLLSIAIATAMWMMVININQPTATRNYIRPLILENLSTLEQSGLTIADISDIEGTPITVRVSAQRTSLDRLSQDPSSIRVSVDLSRLTNMQDGQTATLTVNTVISGSASSYEIISRTPSTITVTVENIVTKQVPVRADIEGEVPAGQALSDAILSEETITVSGASSAVEKVAYVGATVPVEDLMEDGKATAGLKAYDIEGQEVDEISLSSSTVTVFTDLLEEKEVNIVASITGDPGDGMTVGTVSCSPSALKVVGKAEDLAKLDVIQVAPINVSDLTDTAGFTYLVEDYLPEGVSLAEGERNIFTVTVEILPAQEQSVSLSNSQVHILHGQADKTYHVDAVSEIQVKGSAEALENLMEYHAYATADVSGLETGTHNVTLNIVLPEGVYTVGTPTATITVEDAADSETDSQSQES